jgi:hypothetical protein
MSFSSSAIKKQPRPTKRPACRSNSSPKPEAIQNAIQLQRKQIRQAYTLQPDHGEPADDWRNAEPWQD